MKSKKDKLIERDRYNNSSKERLSNLTKFDVKAPPIKPPYIAVPYEFYYKTFEANVTPNCNVLDICCGDGIHSFQIAKSGASITAIDIANYSIEIAKKRAFENKVKNITFREGDAESLNFPENSFDLITMVGSLSYLDFERFIEQIKKVLKPQGKFIIVDSFNHNPIYRLNRYIHYLKGDRTKSTLMRMPDIKTINKFESLFEKVEVTYFGVFAFLGGFIKLITNDIIAKEVVNYLDKEFYFLRNFAFKIVIVASDPIKPEK